jgi:hypothetical protein
MALDSFERKWKEMLKSISLPTMFARAQRFMMSVSEEMFQELEKRKNLAVRNGSRGHSADHLGLPEGPKHQRKPKRPLQASIARGLNKESLG